MDECGPSSPSLRRDLSVFAEASAAALRAIADEMADEENLETCVFTKRTHRFWRRFFVYHTNFKILMSFAEEICRWVRFGKRTHREGVFGGVWRKSGFVLKAKPEYLVVSPEPPSDDLLN